MASKKFYVGDRVEWHGITGTVIPTRKDYEDVSGAVCVLADNYRYVLKDDFHVFYDDEITLILPPLAKLKRPCKI